MDWKKHLFRSLRARLGFVAFAAAPSSLAPTASAVTAAPALTAVAVAAVAACQTSHKDLERWGSTENGLVKLQAVMRHPKYDVKLRREAALTLIDMKPRGGRRVGIEALLDTLPHLPPRLRSDLMPLLTQSVIERLEAPRGEGPDLSIPFKDVAHALLRQNDGTLLSDPVSRTRLEDALTNWALADFARRLEAPGQRVNMQRMLADIGPRSVAGLPELIRPEAPRVEEIVRILAEVADDATKTRAAEKLVIVGRYEASAAWREARSKELEGQDAEAFRKAGTEAIQKHLLTLQEEEVLKLQAAMRRLAQPLLRQFLVEFASDAQYPEKQRLGALAALEGQVATDTPTLDRLWALASDEKTPEVVRASAFVRFGEAPREVIAPRLETGIKTGSTGVRLAAAEVLLGKTKKEHAPQFLELIGQVENMGVGEPLRYGRLLGAIEGFDARSLDSYIEKRSAPVAARLTALGYYYAYGTNDQRSTLARMSEDTQKVPECKEGDTSCSWVCGEKAIATVGDFFQHCVEPHMEARKTAPGGTPGAPGAPQKSP
jgi:hypothetical protein